MSEKIPAKVDYLKPLEEKPYSEVVAEKESYHQEVKEKLAGIVGEKNVTEDPIVIKKYSSDLSFEPPGRPSFVVFPKNTREICELVKLANEMVIPVLPVSSGTHNYGCTLPGMGGIVVNLSGWKKIHKIDYRNRATRIEPGVTYEGLSCPFCPEKINRYLPRTLRLIR